MLNKQKVMQALQEVSQKLFVDFSHEYEKAEQIWNRICSDATLKYKLRTAQTAWSVPDWYGTLNDVVPLSAVEHYTVLATDGSQIYPDRHQGTTCFLVNIGVVTLCYGIAGTSVSLDSFPTVFSDEDQSMSSYGTELVNCRRQELEFKTGLAYSKKLKNQHLLQQHPLLFLFDGSLIFWHLEGKEHQLKQTFLSCYLVLLHQMYEEKIYIAGYISLAKSKELVNILRIALCNFQMEGCELYKEIDHVVDTTVASFYIPKGSRSTIFSHQSSVSDQYPEHLRPHFFYINIGSEIGRVEIPAWIAQDESAINDIAAIILDQSIKGYGYPVALAEAHEQAVVKGPDRDFFYHLIAKVGIEQKRHLILSQKSRKKRGIGI